MPGLGGGWYVDTRWTPSWPNKQELKVPYCVCVAGPLCSCSLNAFVVVFARGLDQAPGGRKKRGDKVTLRELQKRVSGSAQDFDEVIKKAKRQSSSTGAAPASASGSVPSSKRASATLGNTEPATTGELGLLNYL